jgi:hypothetical protein
MVSFSARRIRRFRQRDAWDALADIEAFIFATEAELEAMEAERVGVHRRDRKPDPELRRRVLGLIWMLTFGGMHGSVHCRNCGRNAHYCAPPAQIRTCGIPGLM